MNAGAHIAQWSVEAIEVERTRGTIANLAAYVGRASAHGAVFPVPRRCTVYSSPCT